MAISTSAWIVEFWSWAAVNAIRTILDFCLLARVTCWTVWTGLTLRHATITNLPRLECSRRTILNANVFLEIVRWVTRIACCSSLTLTMFYRKREACFTSIVHHILSTCACTLCKQGSITIVPFIPLEVIVIEFVVVSDLTNMYAAGCIRNMTLVGCVIASYAVVRAGKTTIAITPLTWLTVSIIQIPPFFTVQATVSPSAIFFCASFTRRSACMTIVIWFTSVLTPNRTII